MKVLALKAMLGKSVLFKYVVLLVRRVPGTHWVLALWLGFIRAYPAFLRGMLPSSVMPLVTNPPPLALRQQFSHSRCLSHGHLDALSKPNRGLAGGGPSVVVQVKSPSCHPTLACLENE